MEKTFEINGRTYLVDPTLDDDNSYRLVYLPTPETLPNSHEAINLIDDSACEDYYGDIDTVADIMKEAIREDAEKPYPWWTLLGAIYEWGSDPTIIEDEEAARSFAEVIDCATTLYDVDMSDEEEANAAKARLNLEDADVTAIHHFVNGSYGTFSLAEEWN